MIRPIIEELDYFPDPVSIYGALRDEPYSSFLDSGMDEGKLGRYSFIGYDPFEVLKCVKGREAFGLLKDTLDSYKLERAKSDIPFTSGCIGYFSYDLRYSIEKLPSVALDDMDMPDFILCLYDVVIIFDNLKKKAFISSSGLPERGGEKNKRRQKERLEAARKRIDEASSRAAFFNYVGPSSGGADFTLEGGLRSNFTKENYLKAVKKAKDLIRRGDIYQVNLSQRFECGFDGDPFELYLKLRSINPAPFAAYLNLGDFKIVSASPERFIRIGGGRIETRPIKGTRPRSADARADESLKRELLSSAKDRAEHIMILDLERNDLGRVSEYGTVAPSEFIITETYATVHHLVSTVEGRLREGTDIVDCLKNCFPGGSITGAPKVRSMEVIEELEPTKRGIYTGSIGYIDFSGNADLSIVIRTIIIKGDRLYFQVGGGIVADSDAEKEYRETLDKGMALAEAVRLQKAAAGAARRRGRQASMSGRHGV